MKNCKYVIYVIDNNATIYVNNKEELADFEFILQILKVKYNLYKLDKHKKIKF